MNDLALYTMEGIKAREYERAHGWEAPDNAEIKVSAGTVRKIEALIAALYGVIGDAAEEEEA